MQASLPSLSRPPCGCVVPGRVPCARVHVAQQPASRQPLAIHQSIGRGRTCSPSLSTISAAASPTAASASVLRTSSLHPWGWQGLRVPGRIELGRGVGLHPGTGLGGGFQGTGVAGAGAGVGRGRGLRRAGSLGVVAAVSGAGASGGGGDSSGSTSQWKAGSSKSKAASSASGSTGKAAGGAKKAKAAKKRSQGTSAAAAADVDKDWDPITELLERVPNRVEPQVRVNGQLMSLKEAEARAVPAPIRALNALEEGIESAREAALGKLAEVLGGVDKEVIIEEGSDEEGVAAEGREGKEGKQSQQGFSSGADATQQANPVYLKDLLREFKGELVVPEEAFAPRVVETTAFDRALADAPPMSAAEFLGFAEKKQVALVTSRGLKRRDGRFEYWDVLVELKEVPGEPALQTNTWRLKVDSQSVPAVLAAYKGPQKEVETVYSTFVEVPSAKPLPAASTISGRIFLECSILAAILQSFLSALIASSTAALLLASSAVLFIVRSVLWPLAKPLLTPVVWVVAAVAKQIAAVLTATWASLFAPGGASLFGFLQLQLAAMFGSGGIAAGVTGSAATASGDAITDVAVDLARDIFIGKLKSSAKAVGMMVFVVLFMAAGAKFTLNRRTRDYTKWDIWQAIEFGQSKPQARVEGSTGVKFEDVAGIDETVQELQELVEYLKDPQRFNLMGTKPPHGVLLEGPPGCGKTLLAKAIAGEAGVPFYQMAGSEFAEVLVGVGAARVRDLFKRAKVNKPAVVFIDEIDALGAARSSAGGDEGADAGVTERETTLNQLLIELDGFDTGQGVVFIGATNRMDMLDAALLRPGRFDRKITIVPPGSKGRAEVLKVHAKKVKMSPHVDLDTIAGNLAGWSGAQLANLLQEAALVAVRRGAGEIEDEDLYTAADRLTLGTPRERWGAEQGKHPMLVRRMAVHEAGLALTALLLIEYDDAQVEPPQRLSIVPRGETPSWTVFNRIDDEAYLFEKRRTLLHRLQVLLGGRAAEEVVWGRDSSTYSQRHVADASWMAYKFVSIWHMAGKVLPRGIPPAWKRRSTASGPSLGFEGSLYADYGFTGGKISDHADDVAADMAHSLLDEAYAATWQLLADHKAALVKAVNVLMAKGEIQGSDLDIILDAYPAGTPVQVVETEAAPGELPEAFAGHSGDTESEGEEEDGRRRRRREEGVEVRKVEGQFRSVLGGILEEKGKEEKVEEEREGVRGAEVSGKDAGVGKDKEEGKKVEGLSSEASEGEREDGEDEEWGEEELDEDEDWAEEDSDEDEDERLILEAMDRKAGAVGGSGEEGSVMEKSGEGRGGEDVKAAEFQTVERGAEVAGLGAVSGEGLGGGDTSEVKAVAKKTQAEGVVSEGGAGGSMTAAVPDANAAAPAAAAADDVTHSLTDSVTAAKATAPLTAKEVEVEAEAELSTATEAVDAAAAAASKASSSSGDSGSSSSGSSSSTSGIDSAKQNGAVVSGGSAVALLTSSASLASPPVVAATTSVAAAAPSVTVEKAPVASNAVSSAEGVGPSAPSGTVGGEGKAAGDVSVSKVVSKVKERKERTEKEFTVFHYTSDGETIDESGSDSGSDSDSESDSEEGVNDTRQSLVGQSGQARQVGQVGQDGVKAQGGAESNGTLGKRKGDEKLGAGDSARDAGETGDGLTLVRPNGKQAEAE